MGLFERLVSFIRCVRTQIEMLSCICSVPVNEDKKWIIQTELLVTEV